MPEAQFRDTAIRYVVLIFVVLSALSGLLTQPLAGWLEGLLPNWRVSPNVTLDLMMSGLPFAVALAAPLACVRHYDNRQLLIFPFVLVGWVLAIETAVWFDSSRVNFAAYIGMPNADALNEALHNLIQFGLAGAVGAVLTALGALLAARRAVTVAPVMVATAAGAIIAAIWAASVKKPADADWPYLFVFWQAIVGSIVGYQSTKMDMRIDAP
jgi:hypothetical protein